MLGETSVPCPFCDCEIEVKIFERGKTVTYLVSSDCPHCHRTAPKIEAALNKSNRKSHGIKTERSYIKIDPRG